MNHKILLIPVLCCTMIALQAQNTTKVFAITGEAGSNNPYLWTNINQVDVKSGQVVRPVYAHLRTAFDFYDGNTKTRRFGSSWQANQQNPTPQMPASYLVAAAAYDVRHNRMYTTPMQQPELRWIDLDDNSGALKIYTAPMPLSAADVANEAGQITRMVIASDGFGYALTNDANHLIRFSTGRKITVEDLGALRDDARNGNISVHVKNTSFGGDMVADADGNLYLISAYHAVFKIDITAMKATYIANIKNLPEGFTTNGAAVDEQGYLLVSSAIVTGGYYRVNMLTWEAEKISGDNKTAGVSDLASSYFAFSKKSTLPVVAVQSSISVYPNPVITPQFRVKFNNQETGRYTVQLLDITGRLVMQKRVDLTYNTQVADVPVPASFTKGIYTVKVIKANGKMVHAGSISAN